MLPLLALAVAIGAHLSPRALAATAVVALLLEAPAGLLLTDLGGIECPTGCGTGQDAAQGLFFLGLPLTVLVLLAGALLSWERRT